MNEDVIVRTTKTTPSKIIIAIIVSAIVFGTLGYWLGGKNNTATTTTKTATATVTAAASVTATSTATDVTADWKTYTNEKYGFSIEYPKLDSTGAVSGGGNEEWIAKELSVGGTLATINFGPPSSAQGGYIWGLTVKSGASTTIEKQIAGQGSQWSDRKESRSIVTLDGLSATVATVTTASHTDLISKTVYLEKDDNIYEISNGAISSSSFDNFYKSFQFTK